MAKKNKRKVPEIVRELNRLIIEKCKDLTTEKQKNAALNEARAEINKKYGVGWRGNNNNLYQGRSSDMFPSIYDDHEYGEYWMD